MESQGSSSGAPPVESPHLPSEVPLSNGTLKSETSPSTEEHLGTFQNEECNNPGSSSSKSTEEFPSSSSINGGNVSSLPSDSAPMSETDASDNAPLSEIDASDNAPLSEIDAVLQEESQRLDKVMSPMKKGPDTEKSQVVLFF